MLYGPTGDYHDAWWLVIYSGDLVLTLHPDRGYPMKLHRSDCGHIRVGTQTRLVDLVAATAFLADRPLSECSFCLGHGVALSHTAPEVHDDQHGPDSADG